MESPPPSLQAIAPAPPMGPRAPSAGQAAGSAVGPAAAHASQDDEGFAHAMAGCQAPADAASTSTDGNATETPGNPGESVPEKRSRSLPPRGKTSPEIGAELPPGMFPGMTSAAQPWVGTAEPPSTGFAMANGSGSGAWGKLPAPLAPPAPVLDAAGAAPATDDAAASLNFALDGSPMAAAKSATTAPPLPPPSAEGAPLAPVLTTASGVGAAAIPVSPALDPGTAVSPWGAALSRGAAGVATERGVAGNSSGGSAAAAGITSNVAVGRAANVAAGNAVNAAAGAAVADDGGAGGDADGSSDAAGTGQHGAAAMLDSPGSATAWNVNQATVTKGTSFAATLGSVAVPVGSPQFAAALADEVQVVVDPALGNGLRSATLRLNPEHLGPVEVRVLVHEQQASVAFTAQHAVAREALEAALPRLRDNLMQQGFVQVALEVGSQGASGAQSGLQQGFQQGFQQGAAAQSGSQHGLTAFGASPSSGDAVAALGSRRSGVRLRTAGGFDGYA